MPRQNTGSVFLRKDGIWTAQITKNGKRIVQYANSQAEAELLRQHLLTAPFDRAVAIEPAKPTLSTFLPRYIAAGNFKPLTQQQIHFQLTVYAIPLLGNKPLSELTPLDCVEFLSELKKKNLASSSVKVIYTLFKTALQTALQWELISSNPAAKIKPPKAVPKNKTFWTVEQTKQFISYSQANSIKWEPLFLLLLSTGLRISEALGLEWSDIDFNRKTLKVQRATVELKQSKFVTQTPKSHTSIRTVGLSQQVLEILDLWEPDRAKRSGPIFRTESGIPPHLRPLGISLKRACLRAGVPYLNLHGLRHQHISLLAHAGVSVKAAQVRAGHANPQMTLNIYTHVLDETDTATVTALDTLLAKGGNL